MRDRASSSVGRENKRATSRRIITRAPPRRRGERRNKGRRPSIYPTLRTRLSYVRTNAYAPRRDGLSIGMASGPLVLCRCLRSHSSREQRPTIAWRAGLSKVIISRQILERTSTRKERYRGTVPYVPVRERNGRNKGSRRPKKIEVIDKKTTRVVERGAPVSFVG
jgi:hypothetical protein